MVSERTAYKTSRYVGTAEVGEEDHTCCTKDAEGSHVGMSKPWMVQELLHRPSIGINLALDQEDRRDMVRTRSFFLHDRKFGLEKLNRSSSTSTLHVDEPIRLPKEDSLAGLARAREEGLRSGCVSPINERMKVQEDYGEEEYSISQRESQPACSGSIRGPIKSTVGTVEIGDKTISYRRDDHPAVEMKEHRQENEQGIEMVDTSGAVSMSLLLKTETGNAPPERREHPAQNGEGLDMVDREMPGGIEAGLIDFKLVEGSRMGDSPGVGRLLNREDKGTIPDNLDMAKYVDLSNDKDVPVADMRSHENDTVMTCTGNDDALQSEEDTWCEEGQGGFIEDATSICALLDSAMASSESSNEFEHEELPPIQREATILKSFPMSVDSLKPSFWHIERADRLPGDSLTSLRCRICILETSQEKDLLWNEIKRCTCLMALQVCLFVFVVLRSGILDVFATPPPT